MLLLFKLNKHISEVDYGFPMLENGSNTYIAMTMLISQRAFFVNNGLNKMNRHVAYGFVKHFHSSPLLTDSRWGICLVNA